MSNTFEKIVDKFVSRKLIVWLASIGLLFADQVSSQEFLYISMVYMGIQGTLDFVGNRGGKINVVNSKTDTD